MIVCVLIPRFSLKVACPKRLDEPVALALLPGARQAVGEVSASAEAASIHPGMALGEALARCPSLSLVPADPARAAELWDGLLERLEGIGAAVESGRPGRAFFAVAGLRAMYGGEIAGVIAAARLAAQMPVKIAVAPNRFAALLAARRGKRLPRSLRGAGGEAVVPPGALPGFLASHPVAALGAGLGEEGPMVGELIATLKRLGLDTLGKLAALSADQVADRFGPLGLRALRLARGEDTPLRPREPQAGLTAEIELPEGTAGSQLDRALELLVERLLAAPERKERTVLALRLSAQIDSGSSWSVEQVLSRPSASAPAISLLLLPRLEMLPEPALALRLRALALGPSSGDQLELASSGGESRRGRISAAVREACATAGPEAVLKVIGVDSRSRIPERRALLAPYPRR